MKFNSKLKVSKFLSLSSCWAAQLIELNQQVTWWTVFKKKFKTKPWFMLITRWEKRAHWMFKIWTSNPEYTSGDTYREELEHVWKRLGLKNWVISMIFQAQNCLMLLREAFLESKNSWRVVSDLHWKCQGDQNLSVSLWWV